jgi:hypothetical protein
MGESFPKTIHILTMIMNEQQTMPYYLSDEIVSKPNKKLKWYKTTIPN